VIVYVSESSKVKIKFRLIGMLPSTPDSDVVISAGENTIPSRATMASPSASPNLYCALTVRAEEKSLLPSVGEFIIILGRRNAAPSCTTVPVSVAPIPPESLKSPPTL